MNSFPVEPSRFGVFLGVMVVLAATPGPANLYSIATGLHKGKRAALTGVIGMNAATLVWFAAAALGLGALVAAAPALFRLLTVAGGLYVAYLGARALMAAARGGAMSEALAERSGSPFLQGFAVQIANPKAMLFFSAVLPPFLDLNRPIGPQLIVFAAATIGLDVTTMSAYGLFGSSLATRLASERFRRGFNLFVGLILLLAAILIITHH